MFRVRRNKDVSADVDTRTRTFFERDDRQTIEEVIEYLFSFLSRLLGDATANLSGRGQNTSVVSDLGETTQSADRGSGGERLKISVVDLGGQTGSTQRVKPDVLCRNRAKTRPGKLPGGR